MPVAISPLAVCAGGHVIVYAPRPAAVFRASRGPLLLTDPLVQRIPQACEIKLAPFQPGSLLLILLFPPFLVRWARMAVLAVVVLLVYLY
jgi:hypothetical protein